MSAQDLHELVALYALDALEGDERDRFERHLAECPTCQGELAGHRATASTLVADEAPSEETWEKIRAAVASPGAEIIPLSADSGDSRNWRWVAAIASIAALVFGAILVADLLRAGEVDDTTVLAAAEQAATEEGAIVSDFLVDDVAVAQVVLTRDGRGYVIPTDELAALESDRTYQLWVINDAAEVISAGVLGADPAPAVFTWTGDVSGFALTREVAGGVISSAGDVVSVISEV
ncbi:MAG TPA: anti-sigma factor [Acidimicrobiia bacterium]